MKTDYKILWVDDEIASIEEDREEIQDFLARRGIKTHFRMIQSDGTSRIHDNIKEGLNDPQLDLIVVDYRMASEGDPDPMDGERLINMIRQSDHVYLPVVFYSSHYNDLLKAVAEAHLDGVYLAQRDRVRQKLELVITSLLRKEETSKHTRGLLMEGVSQIDASLGDLLMSVWGRLDAAGKATLHTYFKAKVEENLQTCIERKEKYPDLEGFEIT
jgi:CheY-like chemotaxis protein